MSKAIFRVCAAKQNDPDSGIEVSLILPATSYEMLDALDQLRLGEDGVKEFGIDECYKFHYLDLLLNERNDLRELNALAQRLSELDDQQAAAFEGLLEMERKGRKNPLELPNLIDLAYSTDCCHVVSEALNDSQLGRFLAESDFLPVLAGLPDEVFNLLDFERIGREHRQIAGGVLVERTKDHPGGYVEQHNQLAEVYKTLDFSLKTPDYTILLEVSKGFFNDPACDSGKTIQLKLPASPESLDAALTALDIQDWREAGWSCLDCRTPSLIDAVSDAEDIYAVNDLAQRLSDMEPKTLTAYKALLSVKDCQNLSHAELLMDTLSQYILSPQYSSPIELAKADLKVILCDPERELLMPCVNLYQYGEALLENCGGVLTDYGLIERIDQQPIQARKQNPWQGGMEMKEIF